MRCKQLLTLFPIALLAACSTLHDSDIATTERGGHHGKTLADVNSYVLRIASLSPDQLTKENLEEITDTKLSEREGGHYAGDFKIDHSLSMHLQLAPHSEADLSFFIEFRPTLPLPKEMNINDYLEQLDKFGAQVIRNNCIAKEELLNTLLKNNWRLFETNLSSSSQDEDGNIDLSSEDNRYATLTFSSNCLAEFSISKGTKHPAYQGIPLQTAAAGDDETQATISFANAVFEKFHFDQVVTNLSVAYVKGRMASMEDATCLRNGQEKSSVRNLLLNTGRYDTEITSIVVEMDLRSSLREWAFGTELMRVKEHERKELLAIPSNSMSDSIITQWLWSHFDSTGGAIELNTATKKSWLTICAKYHKSAM